MATSRTILFAGGGTGGHIYPNLAIWEHLKAQRPQAKAHFLVSPRPVDASILNREGLPFTSLDAKPLSLHPLKLWRFYRSLKASQAYVAKMIEEMGVVAIVTTGGFVSGPAALAGRQVDRPVIMVNLDAVPGKANRYIARMTSELYTVYPHVSLPAATPIGLPLRQSAIGPADVRQARQALKLDPDKPTLLVTGASLGAQSINQMLPELVTLAPVKRVLASWQILHLAGREGIEETRASYDGLGLDVRVEGFCHQMGLAWRSATLAISRCGAGSVAEAWANAVPTIFLPYPHHRDQHQKFNAQPLVAAGAALMLTDLIDPLANARQLSGPLVSLMTNDARRQQMIEVLRTDAPPNGAKVIADWLAKMI